MEKLGFYRNQRNLLEVQSLDIQTLIDKYGSPLYVYDGNLIETCYNNLANALKPINGHIHYAIKANDRVVIIIGPIANPSKPSVKLTAFALPTITIAAKI